MDRVKFLVGIEKKNLSSLLRFTWTKWLLELHVIALSKSDLQESRYLRRKSLEPVILFIRRQWKEDLDDFIDCFQFMFSIHVSCMLLKGVDTSFHIQVLHYQRE